MEEKNAITPPESPTNGRFSPMPIYTTLEKPVEKPTYSTIENVGDKSAYRTLQSQTGQGRQISTNGRAQRGENRKHYHTAPRDKHRVKFMKNIERF